MRLSSRLWKCLAIGALVTVVIVTCVSVWVVPRIIVGRLQDRLIGKVDIRGWWIDFHSAGVVGLTIREGPEANSPLWASADRVSTDVSLWRVLQGAFLPRRVVLNGPDFFYRLNRKGEFINLPELRAGQGGGSTPMPAIAIERGKVTFHREGRPEDMVVTAVSASITPSAAGKAFTLKAASKDPQWGNWHASGAIDPGEAHGEVHLKGRHVEADPERLARVPFVPSEVWTHVAPRGPVDVDIILGWGTGASKGFRSRTEVSFLGTNAGFPSLGLDSIATTGKLVVEAGIVRLEQIRGRSIGGLVAAAGTLNFARSPSQFDIDLNLSRVNVVDTPKTWQLSDSGITGLLTGKVALRIVLEPAGVDLSGSSGEAVVEGGSFQGIPFKSLKLAMHAQGKDLQFDTAPPAAMRPRETFRVRRTSFPSRRDARTAALAARAIVEDLLVLELPPAEPAPAPAPKPAPHEGGLRLPRSLHTTLELEDIDVRQVITKAELVIGLPLPIPVSGRLSLKAEVTIPLGSLRKINQYVFHGDLTLAGASIDRVDFGRLRARIDMADGVLDIKDLRGRLVDRPDGTVDNPPQATPPLVDPTGPLPPSGFRGAFRAELDPPGRLTARLEGNKLPLDELTAPFFPPPTPVNGLVTLNAEAGADLRSARDPESWTVSGRFESEQIRYQEAVLDRVAFRLDLGKGRLAIRDLMARLDDRPLSVDAGLELHAPWVFEGALNVSGWDIASLEALIPDAPRPSPVAGAVTVRAEARGSLRPWSVSTRGQGQLARFRAGPVPLGNVPFRWTTEGDSIALAIQEARPFGGHLSADVRVPTTIGRSIEGSAALTAVDLAQLAAVLPGRSLAMAGKADGSIKFSVPQDARESEINVRLSAPDLMVHDLPADNLLGTLRAHHGVLHAELTAESRGSHVKFLADYPLRLPTKGTESNANGELRIVGFALDELWKALDMSGATTRLGGVAGLNANLRDVLAGPDKGLWAHGIVDLRDLRWAGRYPLGQLRGIVVKTPVSWRVESLTGDLLGGPAGGELWGAVGSKSAERFGFNIQVDRASLKSVFAPVPMVAKNVDGYGSVRLLGALGNSFRVGAEITVPQAKIAGVTAAEVRAPAELVIIPGTGAGTLTVRRASARIAGGHVRADAALRFGEDHSFHSQVALTNVDLQTLVRLESDTSRPASGRLTGRISLSGPDPANLARYRGKVNLDLDDASLVAVPIFREIDKFLGSARGGLFEDGDLVGTIANRQLIVETMTLEGRLVQLHATGTVGFDTSLNLEVLVNTGQLISQSGQALVGVIPGLREVIGRGDQAARRVGSYLSSRLVKLRVTGTLQSPSVVVDPSIVVVDTAVAFFSSVLKLPLGFLR